MRDLNKLVRNGKRIGGIGSDLKPEQQMPPEKVQIRRKQDQSRDSHKVQSCRFQSQGGGMQHWVDDGEPEWGVVWVPPLMVFPISLWHMVFL